MAFSPEEKARKALQYAEERLAEANAMAAKNRAREMVRAANDYDGFMAMVNKRAEEAERRGVSENVSEIVALATTKHLDVLDRLQERAPEQARQALTRARTASMNGQINALRALAKNKPGRAIDISENAIKNRIEKARAKFTDNVTTENVAPEVEEVQDYAARIAELEEEMTAMAEEKGIDITAIQRRLAQSTSKRMEVLAGVYEKVPETAKPAIERALGNSVRKYERAVDSLKERNALGKIPEEAPALQRVQEKVKERLLLKASNRAEATANVSANAAAQNRI